MKSATSNKKPGRNTEATMSGSLLSVKFGVFLGKLWHVAVFQIGISDLKSGHQLVQEQSIHESNKRFPLFVSDAGLDNEPNQH